MARDPAFLFYPSDFLTGVTFLTDEEVGKYIRLLCLMHQHGRLDEESVCKAIGLVSAKLKTKFSIDENGLWFNERLEEEIEKRNKFTESRRNNGLLGGRGKKKDKAIGLPNNKATENLSINRNENKDDIVFSNDNNKKLETWILDVSTSFSIEAAVVSQNKISSDEAKYLIGEFISQIRATGTDSHNLTDFKSHCINWCRTKKHLLDSGVPKGKFKTLIEENAIAKKILDNEQQ